MADPAPAEPDGTPRSSPERPGPDPASTRRRRRFVGLLLLIVVAAWGLRVAYVLGAKAHEPLLGDQIYYSALADTLARGLGFRDPFISDRVVPSADHPPLTSIIAAPAEWFTDDDDRRILLQRLLMTMVGAATVAAVGVAAREMAGSFRPDAVGLTAAALAAVHPGLWINDGLVMAESVGALTIALVVFASYRALRRPGWMPMAMLGGAIGLAALARAEALLLAPLLAVPIAATRRGAGEGLSRSARFGRLGLAAAGCVLVLAPWVGPNLLRFNQPTTLSTNDGLTLLGTNCDPAFRGSSKGLWILSCIGAVSSAGDGVDDWTKFQRGIPRLGPGQDYSDTSAAYRDAAFRYAREHAGDLPAVMAVRVARLWGAYAVPNMVVYNEGEGRERWASWAAVAAFYLLAPASVAGARAMRRRGIAVWPLAVHVVAATLTALLFYGLWRFRIGAEVAMVMATAVAGVAAAERFRRSPTADDGSARLPT